MFDNSCHQVYKKKTVDSKQNQKTKKPKKNEKLKKK